MLPSVFASPTLTHNTCDELVWAEDLEAERCRSCLWVYIRVNGLDGLELAELLQSIVSHFLLQMNYKCDHSDVFFMSALKASRRMPLPPSPQPMARVCCGKQN